MRHAKEYRRGSKVKALVFFAVLAVALAASLALPLRPTESHLEKRELAAFPPFSMEALWSGEFFRGIDLWFSDTFPARDDFFHLNKNIRRTYGIQTVEIHGEIKQGDEIPTTPFTGS